MTEIDHNYIKNILIIGSGTMGWKIGLQAAISGYEVMMYDLSDEVLEKSIGFQDKTLRKLVKAGLVDPAQTDAIKGRISWTTDPASAAADADLVSESVTEDKALKIKVWEQFAPLLPEHSLLTTNTSYMLPSWFAEASGAPERFAAWHFHDVFNARVVDIMPHPGTAAYVNNVLYHVSQRINQIPVYIKNESQGYIFNFMLAALINSAMTLVARGTSSIEDVDRSFMGNFNLPFGPFGMIDEIGLDTAWHVTKNTGDPKVQPLLDLLKGYIDEGHLGVKTGHGFYKYPGPAYMQESFLLGDAPGN